MMISKTTVFLADPVQGNLKSVQHRLLSCRAWLQMVQYFAQIRTFYIILPVPEPHQQVSVLCECHVCTYPTQTEHHCAEQSIQNSNAMAPI